MRGDFAERVVAEQSRLDVDAGEAITIDRKARDFVVGQPRADRQALEILGFLELLAKALAIARLDVDELGQLIDRLVEILDARRCDLERICRVTLREHDTVAIGDDATIGHDRHDRDTVRFRQRLEVRVLDDLQVEEATEQPAERDEHEERDERQPASEQEQLALGIAQFGCAQARAARETAAFRREQQAADAHLTPSYACATATAAAASAAAPTRSATAAHPRAAARGIASVAT